MSIYHGKKTYANATGVFFWKGNLGCVNMAAHQDKQAAVEEPMVFQVNGH